MLSDPRYHAGLIGVADSIFYLGNLDESSKFYELAADSLNSGGSHSPAVMKAIEGSLGGIKATEIAQIASKVKGQL